VAILGPNGCGKSTLIKTLTCECYPIAKDETMSGFLGGSGGTFHSCGAVWEWCRRSCRASGPPVTTGRDVVVSGFFSASTLWPNLHVTDEMRERAAEAMALMQAERLAGKFVGQMSAGEQRRIMIARALVHRPEMLLLDEPSNALDLAAQRELREALRRVARGGTGILMVTHHLADILPEIDRVIMMKDGKIFADGAKEELITREMLSALFEVDLELTVRHGYFHSW
jgi:iron complex transport system ATP-binding protein